MKVVACVSTFCEGELAKAAIQSVRVLDHVLVADGPVEGNEPSGPATVLPREDPRTTVLHGAWETDAAKRTAMLEWVKGRRWLDGATWVLWLDGDEILLWGEYLRDWLARVTEGAGEENMTGGWPLSLVELDGSVVWCMGKLVRAEAVARYLVSSSYIELVNGDRRTVGNVDAWNPLEGPLQWTGEGAERRPHWRARLPLQGEPHLLHRPVLRARARLVERQHRAEERNYQAEPDAPGKIVVARS